MGEREIESSTKMVIENMEQDEIEHGVTPTRAALNNFLCPGEEDDVIKVVSF